MFKALPSVLFAGYCLALIVAAFTRSPWAMAIVTIVFVALSLLMSVVIIWKSPDRKQAFRGSVFGCGVGLGIAAVMGLLICLVQYVLPPIIVYFWP